LFVAFAEVGCAREPLGPVGVSRPHTIAPAVDRSIPVILPALGDAREKLSLVGSAHPSLGHGGLFDADVYASDSAAQALAAGADMPDGALLAEEIFARRNPGSYGLGIFLMRKRDGAWQFSIVPDSPHPTRTDLCSACHRDAPHDSVFAFVLASHNESSDSSRDASRFEDTGDGGGPSVQRLTPGAPSAHLDVVDAAPEANPNADGGK
jgi:hypothetical protein